MSIPSDVPFIDLIVIPTHLRWGDNVNDWKFPPNPKLESTMRILELKDYIVGPSQMLCTRTYLMQQVPRPHTIHTLSTQPASRPYKARVFGLKDDLREGRIRYDVARS